MITLLSCTASNGHFRQVHSKKRFTVQATNMYSHAAQPNNIKCLMELGLLNMLGVTFCLCSHSASQTLSQARLIFGLCLTPFPSPLTVLFGSYYTYIECFVGLFFILNPYFNASDFQICQPCGHLHILLCRSCSRKDRS